jgi:hypothetical protein
LPSGIRLGEVARRIERDVDQGVFGELAAVVPGERVHTGADRIQGMQDRSHRGVGFTVDDTPHAQQARLALDQRDDASEALADDRVTLPVATMKVAMPTRWRVSTMAGRCAAETLTMPRCAAAVPAPWLAVSQRSP